jgi:uncharacterized membrane protein YhaH (DUF805 family)
MGWYVATLKRFTDFGGRSRRKEFWPFIAVNFVLNALAGALDTALGLGGLTTVSGPGFTYASFTPGIFGAIVGLVLLLPNIAVGIRRLHDSGRSGWWLLLVLLPVLGWIALIVFWALDGERRPNAYGPDPKASEHAHV